MLPNGLEGKKISMAQLANSLSGIVGPPVIDKTGYTANFDFHLEFTRDVTAAPQLSPAARGQRTGDARRYLRNFHFHRDTGTTRAETRSNQRPCRHSRNRPCRETFRRLKMPAPRVSQMVGDDTTPECLETGHLTRVRSAPSLCATPVVYPEGQAVQNRDRPRNLRLCSQEAADCARCRAHNRCTPGPANLPSRARFAARIRPMPSRSISFAFDSHRIPLRYPSAVAIWASNPASTPPSSPIRVHPVHRRRFPASPASQIPRPGEQRKSPHPPSRSTKTF